MQIKAEYFVRKSTTVVCKFDEKTKVAKQRTFYTGVLNAHVKIKIKKILIMSYILLYMFLKYIQLTDSFN